MRNINNEFSNTFHIAKEMIRNRKFREGKFLLYFNDAFFATSCISKYSKIEIDLLYLKVTFVITLIINRNNNYPFFRQEIFRQFNCVYEMIS